MIIDVTVRIVRNVGTRQPDLTILDRDVRLLQLDPPGHDALNLRPEQNGSCLIFIEDVILVIGEAVIDDLFVVRHSVLS